MGSVKDLIREGRGGSLYREAEPYSLGLGAWGVSGRFSVGDLKKLIPSQEIAQKGPALAMMAGFYWEQAANDGFQHTYSERKTKCH